MLDFKRIGGTYVPTYYSTSRLCKNLEKFIMIKQYEVRMFITVESEEENLDNDIQFLHNAVILDIDEEERDFGTWQLSALVIDWDTLRPTNF